MPGHNASPSHFSAQACHLSLRIGNHELVPWQNRKPRTGVVVGNAELSAPTRQKANDCRYGRWCQKIKNWKLSSTKWEPYSPTDEERKQQRQTTKEKEAQKTEQEEGKKRHNTKRNLTERQETKNRGRGGIRGLPFDFFVITVSIAPLHPNSAHTAASRTPSIIRIGFDAQPFSRFDAQP